MKSIMKLAGVLILSMIVTTAFGQQRGQGMRNANPEDMANRQLEQMKEIIKLKNNKEEKAVKEVFIKYSKKRREMFSNMDRGQMQQNREKMQKLTNEQNEELKKILGEERYDTYEKKMQELRQQRRRR